MKNWLCTVLFIAYTCFATVLSCSCPPESWGKPREQGIQDDFEYSTNVYTAIVSSADCKCFPASEDPATCPTILDCVNYAINDSGVIVESVGKRYECLQGFPCPTNSFYGFEECEHVEEVLVSSSSVEITPDQDIPVTNVTGEGNCGITEFDGEGCQLSYQPCHYNVTVTTVYKGNLISGDILATSGPDVLTTCGEFGRLLTLGVEYVVGIGGPCSPMAAWSTLESYSAAEVALLEALQECPENPSICIGTMGTDQTLATSVVTTSDTDPVTMDTDPTLDTVMTTSDIDPVTMGTDGTKPPVKNDDLSSGAPPVSLLRTSFLFALVMPFYHSFLH